MNKKSFFNFEFKSVEVKDGKVKVKGFASTPDIDRYDDIVDTKAFENTMSTYMKNPVILLQHDSDKPIGRAIDYKLSSEGLEITAEITENTDNVIEKINNKTLGAFSIGFIANKWEMTEKEVNGELRRIREIKEIDLVEISIVSTPANANAVFTITKSLKKLFDEIETETVETETEQNEEKIDQIETIETETEEVKEEEKETVEEEKGCGKNKHKKSKLEKSFFEEKRVLLSGELSVGDLVRFTKIEWDNWECTIEEEVEQGEIIKIIETEDPTNPTLYILEYELTLDGFKPSDEMCVISFRNTVIEKISEMQLKEFAEVLANEEDEATKTETETDELETPAEMQAEETQEQEVENNIEIDIEKEVEKHFEAKAIVLNESFETKAKDFAEKFEAKMQELEAKETAIKSIFNETAELKATIDSNLKESKAIMERLLKIAINKGATVSYKKQYNPYETL